VAERIAAIPLEEDGDSGTALKGGSSCPQDEGELDMINALRTARFSGRQRSTVRIARALKDVIPI